MLNRRTRNFNCPVKIALVDRMNIYFFFQIQNLNHKPFGYKETFIVNGGSFFHPDLPSSINPSLPVLFPLNRIIFVQPLDVETFSPKRKSISDCGRITHPKRLIFIFFFLIAPLNSRFSYQDFLFHQQFKN